MFFSLSLYQHGRSTALLTHSVPNIPSACTELGQFILPHKCCSSGMTPWNHVLPDTSLLAGLGILRTRIPASSHALMSPANTVCNNIGLQEVSVPGSALGMQGSGSPLQPSAPVICPYMLMSDHGFTSFILLIWFWTAWGFLILKPYYVLLWLLYRVICWKNYLPVHGT